MSELEQTIEELEAEVLAEREEASAASDPKKKGAAPAEGKKSVDKVTPGGEVQDGGEPVVEPEAKDSPTDVAADDAGVHTLGCAWARSSSPAHVALSCGRGSLCDAEHTGSPVIVQAS